MTRPGRSLRPARRADRRFLRDLAGCVFSHLGPYGRMIPEWIDGSGARARIALEDGRPVGFALTCLAMLPREDPAAKGPVGAPRPFGLDLLAIAVVPERQRHGIGGWLLDEVLFEARQTASSLPLVEVTLTVAEENAAARHLFESRGFLQRDGTDVYPRGQTALNFAFPLGATEKTRNSPARGIE